MKYLCFGLEVMKTILEFGDGSGKMDMILVR
jgi:hypothetical protein